MLKTSLLFACIGMLGILAKADTLPTRIFGTDKSYAGQIITLYAQADLISGTPVLLASDTVAPDGSFNLPFDLNQTQLLTLPLGIYECILYCEPHHEYQVVLPPNQPKAKADFFNPFFKPVQIYLGIKNSSVNDINQQIAAFDEKYHNYVDSNYYYIFKHPREANIDSVITRIESHFDTIPSTYFFNYRKYKYAWLKYTTIMRDSRYVIREYFNNQAVLYTNTAYVDLFNQLFANYLNYYMKTSEGERLYSDIAYAKSPTFIKQTFSNNMVLLNDTLQELVLLKGLHDAFYTTDFPLPSLLITLDSLANFSKIPMHRNIANLIHNKVLQARSGFPAPDFKLSDTEGVVRSNKEYLSNYVYLSFISTESYACQKELGLLKVLYDKHKDDFRVVSISVDDQFEQTKAHFKQNGFDWPLLHDTPAKQTASAYKVRTYPSYYLIGPDGKLIMSPAPGPAENFEWYFFNLLQSKRRGQNR